MCPGELAAYWTIAITVLLVTAVNPAGVETVIVVFPALRGVNVAVAEELPPEMVTLGVTVPMEGVPLVRETVTELNPANGCAVMKYPLESSTPVTTVMVVGPPESGA